MKAWAKFFVVNYKFTFIVTLFFIILGVLGLKIINAESFPAVDFATAIVTAPYDGAPADDIEAKILMPIEEEIRKVKGLKEVRSLARPGLGTIVIKVDMDNVHVPTVLNDLQKAVDRVSKLPQDMKDRPSYLEINSQEFPAIEIALTGPNEKRKRDLLATKLKETLEDSKNVLGVRLIGHSERQFSIFLSKEKLKKYHISIGEILRAIGSRNINIPGGNVQTSIQQNLLRVEGKIKNTQELGKIVIRSNFSGKTLYLQDVSTILDSFEEKKLLAHYNEEEAVLLIVNKKAGADTIKLVKEVNDKLEIFRKLYPDYQLKTYANEAEKVKNKLEVLGSNALSGLVLVFVFLLLFLPGRIGIMASLSLPIVVFTILGFMPVMGMNLDTITVLALVIALGMLVDNSVVISENYNRLREEGKNPTDAAIDSIVDLWFPITATALTTIAAFLPMLVTKGIMGQFIKFIPIIVTLSLLLSLVESFFLLPMRLVWISPKQNTNTNTSTVPKKDWFAPVLEKFEKLTLLLVKKRYFVSLLFTFILAGVFFLIGRHPIILFPSNETEIYVARYEMPANTPLEQTEKAGEKLVKEIQKRLGPNIQYITLRAGTSGMGAIDPKGKTGDIAGLVLIYMTKTAAKELYYLEVLKKLEGIQFPEMASLLIQEMRNGPPVGEPIDITFRSDDHVRLLEYSKLFQKKLREIKGVFNVKDDEVFGDEEIFVSINYEKAARLGITIKTIGDTIRTAFQGSRIGNIVSQNKEVNLFVRLQKEDRKNIQDLEELKVEDMRGNLISLKDLASFDKKSGAPFITRFDFKRAVTITGQVDTKVLTPEKANKEALALYEQLRKEYPSVFMAFGGEGKSTQESMESLFSAMILALIGIFAILVLTFNSYIRPLIIMSTIPLGLIGFILAFIAHQKVISFLAMIGLIGLAGIIVNNGIVLISFIDQLKEQRKDLGLENILAMASKLRLRAVVVTSLTTISGLFPTAYGIGGTDPMLIDMTLAMAWGLTSGTILTILWVPCAYGILEDISNFFSSKKIKLEEIKNA